jgi:DNA-binding NarL/FixJ family response regulator
MAHRVTSSDPSAEPIRLVIVERRAILGAGVREILDREPDFDVVGHVQSTAEAISLVAEFAPDVVLVDAALPEASATEATRRLRQEIPGSALVVIGRQEDEDGSIVGAVGVGATAHVPELVEPAELVATIRRVADGEDPIKDQLITRPDLVERIVDGVRETILAGRGPENPLSPREREVLAQAARGHRNREIGERLGVSEQTVKNHLSSAMHKLGAPNRTRAVLYAVRQGWLSVDEGAEVAAPAEAD